MPSFISSSDMVATRIIPSGPWLRSLFGAVAVLLMFVAVMEMRLAARGFHATVVDSDALWLRQRLRASELGTQALILVGASRMQLDMDLDVLRQRTHLEPVQLAIDGSSFVPVLEGLANDPRITGTVLVDFQDDVVNEGPSHDAAERLTKLSNRTPTKPRLPNFHTTEAALGDALHYHLRSYADGASPLSSLMVRILPKQAIPQYLITLPDRSRLADYRSVPMPDFYFARVVRNLGQQVQILQGTPPPEVDAELRRRVEALAPAPPHDFDRGIMHISGMADAIARRGGRVIFVVMPRTGLVRTMDDKRYPRGNYWNKFVASTHATTLNLMDVPAIGALVCPDGSHLDFRDRARFTGTAVAALGLDRPRLQPGS